jgi:hypothetical protein
MFSKIVEKKSLKNLGKKKYILGMSLKSIVGAFEDQEHASRINENVTYF